MSAGDHLHRAHDDPTADAVIVAIDQQRTITLSVADAQQIGKCLYAGILLAETAGKPKTASAMRAARQPLAQALTKEARRTTQA